MRERRAFTLVEMLVAIGIIAILLALTLVAGSAVLRRTDVTRTERTIQVLDLALAEWSTRADRALSWGSSHSDLPIEWHDVYGDIPHVLTTSDALRIIARNEFAREILATMDTQYLIALDPKEAPPVWLQPTAAEPDPNAGDAVSLFTSGLPNPDGTRRTFEDQLAVLDAWGRAIRMVHPGRLWRRGDDPALRDEDGTIRTAAEQIYGICRGRQPYFVSAGRSGRFGNLSSTDDTIRLQGSDNLYSYEVEKRMVTP